MKKICRKCGRVLDATQFGRNSRRKDGTMAVCKDCVNAKANLWKSNNRERDRANQIAGYNDRVSRGLCKFCTNPQMPHSNRLCEKHWYVEIATENLGAGTVEVARLLKDKLESQNYTCPYTGEKLVPGLNCHLDHILPTSRFPEKRHDIDNVEWVSERANYAKRDLTPQEFIELCNRVTEYRNGTVSSTETGVNTRTPVESDIRPTAVSLAASLKQEPSAESYGRFW